MSTQPPDPSLQPFVQLAQDIRTAATNRDYTELGRLIAQNLEREMVDMMVYVRGPLGNLTIIGRYVDLWSPLRPEVLGHEPGLDEMAVVLRSAARR